MSKHAETKESDWSSGALTFIGVRVGDLEIKVNLLGSILFDDELLQLRQRKTNTIECYLVVVFIVNEFEMNVRHLGVETETKIDSRLELVATARKKKERHQSTRRLRGDEQELELTFLNG